MDIDNAMELLNANIKSLKEDEVTIPKGTFLLMLICSFLFGLCFGRMHMPSCSGKGKEQCCNCHDGCDFE